MFQTSMDGIEKRRRGEGNLNPGFSAAGPTPKKKQQQPNVKVKVKVNTDQPFKRKRLVGGPVKINTGSEADKKKIEKEREKRRKAMMRRARMEK